MRVKELQRWVVLGVLASSSLFCHAGTDTQNARTSDFGFGWKFFRGDAVNAQQINVDESGWSDVQIPHDRSIEGTFSKTNAGGLAGGYVELGIGWYRKTFNLSPRKK